MSNVTRVAVAIVGSGFAGIAAGIRLKTDGLQDFVMLEAGSDVGGTWRDNTYPGAACDIPSHLYSFSFEPKADWTRSYAPGEEIQQYMVQCVDRHGLRDHLFLNTAVQSAVYDEDRAEWTLTAADGRVFVATAVIAGLGPLREPSYPDLEGMDTFEGVAMHTARWDHDVDLAGKRVAVIGTGASSIQVVPAIAEETAHVTLFQRTPPWVLPRFDFAYPGVVKTAFKLLPGLRALHRTRLYWQKEGRFIAFGPMGRPIRPVVGQLAKAYMRSVIDDPELRARLTPDYDLGCKRILISDDYLPALARDDVSVVSDGIARITPAGIETNDGVHHDVDVIIFGTGFDVRNILGQFEVTGRDGASLNERWNEFPATYLGTTVPDFPNLFMMVGPNTGLGHNSMVFMMESQLNYVAPAIDDLINGEIAEYDVTHAAAEDFRAEMARRHEGGVWATGGCESWYLAGGDENFTLWPGSTVEYRLRTATFDPRPYRVTTKAELKARRDDRDSVDA